MPRTSPAAALACAALVLLPAGTSSGQAPQLPIVWVLATSGIIAGQGATSTSLTDYRTGLLGEQLVKGVPELAKVARVEVEQIANVSSTDITVGHWLTLARRIDAIYRDLRRSKP